MSDTETGSMDVAPWDEWTQADSGLIRAVYGFDSITVLPAADGGKTLSICVGSTSISVSLPPERAVWLAALLAAGSEPPAASGGTAQ